VDVRETDRPVNERVSALDDSPDDAERIVIAHHDVFRDRMPRPHDVRLALTHGDCSLFIGHPSERLLAGWSPTRLRRYASATSRPS
jgi:hypothetical protein